MATTNTGITISPGSRSKKKMVSKFTGLDHDETRDTLDDDVAKFLSNPDNVISEHKCGESGVYDT